MSSRRKKPQHPHNSSPDNPLVKARKTRALRAKLFHDMQHNVVTLQDVLARTPACARNAKIYDIVRHAHRMGDTGAVTVLRKAKVEPMKRVSRLTQTEKTAILKCMPPRAK